MIIYAFTVQTSRDRGATWDTGPVTIADPAQWRREGADELTAEELASDVLDQTYRQYLDGDGTEAIPLLQVFVWNRAIPSGPPTATSATGLDSQWQATGDLIAEIAADIRHFEEEKRRHDAAAASAQLAITNARHRLASVVTSAARMQMPQVTIAHKAGRSREWVRKTVG
ncbi:hypothetical protein [Streptomyces sp. NBC_01174]|uniref:hypothetical protein n=1 Tax=Streptomyces sp. NBC_01174 TaxID=2903758 RepID=UPI002F916646|nr:hypothetical protein OG414_40890 [Streptomyces sp. NBC_01174]